MSDSSTEAGERQTERISLLDSLDGEWLKLPLLVMRDVGPAAQTLAGLLNVTNRETYSAVEAIANRARLPVGTVRKHLVTLHAAGWIYNAGRGHTKRGRPRRTATIRIADKTRKAMDTTANKGELLYGILPWWACCSGKVALPWSARAVLSIVVARLASLRKVVDEQAGDVADIDEFTGHVSNMGGDENFRFSLDHLSDVTGLSRHSVIEAKRLLYRHRIFVLTGTRMKPGIATERDTLEPNWDFRAVVRPTSNGFCNVSFWHQGGGCKSGQ